MLFILLQYSCKHAVLLYDLKQVYAAIFVSYHTPDVRIKLAVMMLWILIGF